MKQYMNLDTFQTAFFDRALTAIDPTKYWELTPGFKARRFVPPVANLSPYDRAYEYTMWKITGDAKYYGQHAKDLPIVGVEAVPFSRPIKPLGAAMNWTLDEIRSAAARQVGLEEATIMAAMSVIARKLDKSLAFGDGINTGLVNDADIINDNTVAAVGGFDSAQDYIDSLIKLVADTRARLKQASTLPGGDALPAFDRFTILMPTDKYTKVKTTLMPGTAGNMTVLNFFLEAMGPWVEGVEDWAELDDDNRAICYPRNPMALGAVIAREYTQEAPQPVGLEINVPVHASSGGTVIRYGVAFSYMTLS